jgi:N-acetylmuramoyl-L-alanine amidase
MCITDNKGNFTPDTLGAAVELVTKLVNENNLTLDEIGTHYKVVGWKYCPRLWFNNPEKFEEFKKSVEKHLKEV